MNVIYDLEATCWSDPPPKQMEIIEIGAVKVNELGLIVDEFDIFIKPYLYPRLSLYCRKLTGITQAQVDLAVSFPAANTRFKEWCDGAALWSWGEDRNLMKQDGRLWGVDVTYAMQTKNLSLAFKRRYQRRKCGVLRALHILGMEFEGEHHRAIDDAHNTARIFVEDMQWYTKEVKE